ncbi:putative porin [Shewanella sp. HL-SH5]|uniref:putative porin n=1 Tax=Shewanella sp. HL-SH5 TaxID=3436241 RepID=UPI003EBA918B
MTKTSLSLALMLALVSSNTFAETSDTFQHEAELGFLDSTENSDGLLNLNYSYYFEPVNQADVPYALAPFLNQYSTISARYAVTDYQDLYNMAGEYVFDSKFFIGGDYTRNTTEGITLFNSDDSSNFYGVNLGYYFTKQSKLTLAYLWNSEDVTEQYDGRYYSDKNKNNLIKLDYQHYLPFESISGLMLNGFILHSSIKNNSDYTLVLEPDDHISSRTSHSENSVTVLGVNADWYITDSWSVGGLYTYFNSDYDFDGINIITTPDTVVNDNYSFSDSNSNDTYSINTRYFWRFSNIFSAKVSLEQTFVDSDSQTSLGIAINARF